MLRLNLGQNRFLGRYRYQYFSSTSCHTLLLYLILSFARSSFPTLPPSFLLYLLFSFPTSSFHSLPSSSYLPPFFPFFHIFRVLLFLLIYHKYCVDITSVYYSYQCRKASESTAQSPWTNQPPSPRLRQMKLFLD